MEGVGHCILVGLVEKVSGMMPVPSCKVLDSRSILNALPALMLHYP